MDPTTNPYWSWFGIEVILKLFFTVLGEKSQKHKAAKPSFFFTFVLHKSLSNTIILFFSFSKTLLQKSLPNTLLLYFTAAYSHNIAESVFFQSTAIPN